MKYQIQIKTGDQLYAGTNSKIKLKIIGSKGETEFTTLDHVFYNDFQYGATDTYTIAGDDIGDIECISILAKIVSVVKYSLSCDWYVDYIRINKNPPFGELVTFPIHQWITKRDHGKEFIISTNKTCIPQKDSRARLKDDRRAQQTKKEVIRWRLRGYQEITELINNQGLPGRIDVDGHENLPDQNIMFTDGMLNDFTKNAIRARSNGIWLGLMSKLQSFNSFCDFKQFSRDLKGVRHPSWILDDTWRQDEEFGREILNGINPAQVRRCKKLPDNFPVTDSHTTGILTRGKGLQEEMDDGNIYIINHEILENISTGNYNEKSIQLAVPICLFYVRDDDEFVPIAIQLGQSPGSDFPIWTPKDKPLDWMLAKMWFKNADFQVHQMRSHLAYTHFLMEPFAVAMYRCLPPVHPIHKLLREHLQSVIAINTIGRSRLIQLVSV